MKTILTLLAAMTIIANAQTKGDFEIVKRSRNVIVVSPIVLVHSSPRYLIVNGRNQVEYQPTKSITKIGGGGGGSYSSGAYTGVDTSKQYAFSVDETNNNYKIGKKIRINYTPTGKSFFYQSREIECVKVLRYEKYSK